MVIESLTSEYINYFDVENLNENLNNGLNNQDFNFIEENNQDHFLFTSESVGEGHPGF